MRTLEDLRNFLIEEADYEPIQVNNMTRKELFDACLTLLDQEKYEIIDKAIWRMALG